MTNKIELIYADERFERIRFYLQELGFDTLEDLLTFDFNQLMFVPGVLENDIKAAKEAFSNANHYILPELDSIESSYDESPSSFIAESSTEQQEEHLHPIVPNDPKIEPQLSKTDISPNNDYMKTHYSRQTADTFDEISEFPLSNRAKNCLRRAGIFTLEKLLSLNETDLMSIRNMGRQTCDEIMIFIKSPHPLKDMPIDLSIPQEDGFFEHIDISNLPLSIRAINCLKNVDIKSLQQLLLVNEEVLMNVKNMGKKTCTEILDFIESTSRQQTNMVACYKLENVDAFNMNIPISLLGNIGVSQKAINFLLDSGYMIINDLCERNITAREYSIMRPIMAFLSISVIEHFINDINSLKNYGNLCVLSRCKGRTLQEIGDEIGVTRERVRQIIAKTCRVLRKSADLIASALFQKQNNIFAFVDLQKVLDNPQIAQCYKLVQQESSYVKYFKFSDKFVCNDICPSNIEQIFTDFVFGIVGDGLNYYENLELVESELHKRSLFFLDSIDVMNFLIQKGYHFYGDYVAKSKQNYANVCIDAVKRYFSFDIKLDSDESNEDMKRLRQIIEKHYQGLSIPPANRALTAAMTRDSTKMILSGRGRYCPIEKVTYSVTLLNEVRDFIKNNSQSSFYYNELFTRFEGRFLTETNIRNSNMLHGMLKCLFPDEFVYERDLLVKSGAMRQDVNDRLKQLLKGHGCAMTKTEIKKEIPGISDFVFAFTAMRLPEIIQWDYNELNHIDNIIVRPDELTSLKEILNYQTNTHFGYCSDALLYTAAKEKCEDFMQRNHIQNAQNLYYITNYLFGAEYRFKRPHIITNDFPVKELSVVNIARILLKCEKELNFEKYTVLADKLGWAGGTLYAVFSELEKDYIRISENNYVHRDYFNISDTVIEALNNLLDDLVRNAEYCAFNSIFDYDIFPKCDYKWNGFLLESIITEYNTDFRIIYPQIRDRRYQRGIVIPYASPLDSFKNLVIETLLANGIFSISESGLEKFLRMKGIITTALPQELFDCPQMVYKNELFIVKQ